jgi:glutamine synthetase
MGLDRAGEFRERLVADGVTLVDFRYAQAGGNVAHVTVAAATLDPTTLAAGLDFEPNTRLQPDLAGARLDTSRSLPTLAIRCEATGAGAAHDPRAIARRAAAWLEKSGVADMLSVAARIGLTLTTSDGPLGPAALGDLAGALVVALGSGGIEAGVLTSDAPTSTKMRVQLRPADFVAAADALSDLAEIAASVGRRAGISLARDRTCPLGLRLSLRRNGASCFSDPSGLFGASTTMLHDVGGILTHAPSLSAFTSATRAEHGTLLRAFSADDPSAAVLLVNDRESGPIAEFGVSPEADPYLTLAATAMAGLDGIARRIDPVRAGFGPLSADLAAERRGDIGSLALDAAAALDALEADSEYLRAGDVFERAFLEHWVAVRRRSLA